MSPTTRVALVTGANKGIGFAIARDLCRQFSGDVVLTARDEARGRAAVQQLQAEGLSPRFHPLDIDDVQSIRALRDFLRKEYGGLDVLVNNAGIAFKTNDPTPFHIQAEVTMKTNFFGTRDVCTELLPLMKPQAMSLFPQVALATGVNKGIGFTIVQDLCCQSPRDIVLTAQDEARGWAAVKQLQARGPNPRFHLLDINDLKSIHTLRDFLCKEYGDLDMLVNTMGIAFKDKDTGTPRPGNFPYRTFHHGLGMVPECYRRACSSSRI